MQTTENVEIGGKTLSISSGHVAKQADGAVTVRVEDTMVLATACAQKEAKKGLNFLPLTVDYRENTFAAGKIPGGFFRREGRPSEAEILICRLTDRTLRPLFPDGYHNETQIIASTISHDLVNEPDTLTIIGASTALIISDIPFDTPIAAVRVGRINGEFVINPTLDQFDESELNLLVASSEEAILMVEAGANEVDEEVMIQALELGFQSAQPIIKAQRDLAAKIGKEKWTVEKEGIPQDIQDAVAAKIGNSMAEALSIEGKITRGERLDELKKSVIEEYEEDSDERNYASLVFDEIKKKVFREGVFSKKKRFDGRKFDEVRNLAVELDFLPRAHGSAIFTRGETQALASTTLGTKSDAQIMDELGGEWKRRFLLHYNFPPYSVGEVRFMRGPGRREIGHGALAARALEPILPPEEEFPYTIRLVSDIMESNGSSSMATVCGGSLSLMAAGVPTKAPVAGIAMGLMKQDDDFIILTDIAGEEDHYGDMDFKVAGTRTGITALQMDIKITGVTTEILRMALQQARAARELILDTMEKTIAEPRADLSPYAPRIVTMKIDPEKIRDVIGKGGAMIRKIIEESGAEIDVEDDGKILLYSPNLDSLEKAKGMIEEIVEEPEYGKIYLGKVVSITDFGAFVQILPTVQGLLHISEIANYRVNQVTDELNIGDEVRVKVIGIDETSGKIRLSRKALMESSSKPTGRQGGGPREGGGSRGGGSRTGGGSRSSSGGRPSGPPRGGAPRRSSGRQNRRTQEQKNGSQRSDSQEPKYRSRRGPQHGGGSYKRPDNNDQNKVRFPGDLGPDPYSKEWKKKY